MLSVASPPSSLRGGIPCHLIPCAFGRDPCMSSRLKEKKVLIRGKMKMRRTCVVEREKGEPRKAHIDLKAFTEVENWWWKPASEFPFF